MLAQSKRDTIAISNYIVKQGYIYSYVEFHSGVTDPSNCINVATTEDSVFSVSDGIVKSFFKVNEYDFVMVESKDAWFTYGHIDISELRKSEKVSIGQFLGLVSNANNKTREVIFAICKKDRGSGSCLTYIDLYDYLKKFRR